MVFSRGFALQKPPGCKVGYGTITRVWENRGSEGQLDVYRDPVRRWSQGYFVYT